MVYFSLVSLKTIWSPIEKPRPVHSTGEAVARVDGAPRQHRV